MGSQLIGLNFRKGSVTIHLNLQICLDFLRKYHELVNIFMHFTMIRNLLQIFTSERSALFCTVLTHFSQPQVFVVLLSLRNIFSVHCSMYITILLFHSKDKSVLYELLKRIFKNMHWLLRYMKLFERA